MQALKGVKVFYTREGPTAKRIQPRVGPEEKTVLQKKIQRFIKKGYICPVPTRLKLSIKYFAVPKGKDNWRILFHTGANELNKRVWAPSFGLPTINSLLRIVNGSSLMSDRDMGDMFHNFSLDKNTGLYTAIDLAPLGFEPEFCRHRWVYWRQNLMGFRSSPYNSSRTYLAAEEIIKGGRHDETNTFRWSRLMLNLPGSEGYKPSLAWITK